jgi:lycopene cyclase domain-containing protein
VDRYQYLLLLAGCVAVTLPLEVVLDARVWRRPLRLAAAVLPGAVIFSAWDVAAIAHRWWSYNPRYVSGVDLPGRLPVEEVAFFLVIPVCALLTFAVVSRAIERWGR